MYEYDVDLLTGENAGDDDAVVELASFHSNKEER